MTKQSIRSRRQANRAVAAAYQCANLPGTSERMSTLYTVGVTGVGLDWKVAPP